MPRKEENLPTCYKCQAQLLNCWIRDFESFDKKKNVKPIYKTVEVDHQILELLLTFS